MLSNDILYLSEICDAFDIEYSIHKVTTTQGNKIVAKCSFEVKQLLIESCFGNFEMHIYNKVFSVAESAKFFIEHLIKSKEKIEKNEETA
jgi:hypothetical protein